MSRFENEIVYFNGFKHITVDPRNPCTLCKIGDHENGNCPEVIICVIKFSQVILKTLNI